MTVLLLERSDAVRARLAARLRDAALVVTGEAATLADALAQLLRLTPDAIVGDIDLPDGRGAGIVAALRARAPAALIVVLTNATHYRASCLARGADHFLDKSADFDDLGALLTAAAPVRARR